MFFSRLLWKTDVVHDKHKLKIDRVSVATVIGVPRKDPERGLLPSFIISTVVIGIERIITFQTFQNLKLENYL